MAVDYEHSTRWNLPKIKGADNLVADLDNGIGALADAIDTTFVGLVQDTLPKRPAAGIPNRLFYATDSKVLFRDNGATWVQVLCGPLAPFSQGVVSSGIAFLPSATSFSIVTVQAEKIAGGAEDVYFGVATTGTGFGNQGNLAITRSLTTTVAVAAAHSVTATVLEGTGIVLHAYVWTM